MMIVNNVDCYTTSDLMKLANVKRHAVTYAMLRGYLPVPTIQHGCRSLWTYEDATRCVEILKDRTKKV